MFCRLVVLAFDFLATFINFNLSLALFLIYLQMLTSNIKLCQFTKQPPLTSPFSSKMSSLECVKGSSRKDTTRPVKKAFFFFLLFLDVKSSAAFYDRPFALLSYYSRSDNGFLLKKDFFRGNIRRTSHFLKLLFL